MVKIYLAAYKLCSQLLCILPACVCVSVCGCIYRWNTWKNNSNEKQYSVHLEGEVAMHLLLVKSYLMEITTLMHLSDFVLFAANLHDAEKRKVSVAHINTCNVHSPQAHTLHTYIDIDRYIDSPHSYVLFVVI